MERIKLGFHFGHLTDISPKGVGVALHQVKRKGFDAIARNPSSLDLFFIFGHESKRSEEWEVEAPDRGLIIQSVYHRREGNARSRLQFFNRNDYAQLNKHCAHQAAHQILIVDGGFNPLPVLPQFKRH